MGVTYPLDMRETTTLNRFAFNTVLILYQNSQKTKSQIVIE